MKAIYIDRFGSADEMQLRQMPHPIVKDDEVLVRVMATSINPVDLQTRRGDYADALALPARLGVDVSGVIEQVGRTVTNFKVGDEVYYVPRLLENEGSYATHHVEKAEIIALKPQSIGHQESAALPLAAGTAWECLVERGRIKKGDHVLIHGGSGGVGVYAIQIAKMFEATVTTTSSKEKSEFVGNLGSDCNFDYKKPGLYQSLRDSTSQGFDIVLDTVGGQTIEKSLDLLASGGRLVSIVDQSNPQNLMSGWEANAEIHFVFTTQSALRLSNIAQAVDSGRLKPIIENVLNLDEIVEGHRLVETGGRKGKIVIKIQ